MNLGDTLKKANSRPANGEERAVDYAQPHVRDAQRLRDLEQAISEAGPITPPAMHRGQEAIAKIMLGMTYGDFVNMIETMLKTEGIEHDFPIFNCCAWLHRWAKETYHDG